MESGCNGFWAWGWAWAGLNGNWNCNTGWMDLDGDGWMEGWMVCGTGTDGRPG